jgi:dihydroorotate dehydrogenase
MMELNDPTFFIAAPFGNWIHHKNAVSVRGTFTLNPQGNRLFAVLKSLRYTKEGWTNKLGLANPGINKGLENLYNSLPSDDIISIAETEREEFAQLNNIIPKNQNIELNLSCPNVKKTLPWDFINQFPNNQRQWCIAKMSPLSTPEEVEYVINQGFRQLHFSNSIPSKKGGLSGHKIIPYTTQLIKLVRQDFKSIHNIEIIAGGGVSKEQHIYDYLQAGANHISIGSAFLTKPRKTLRLMEQ